MQGPHQSNGYSLEASTMHRIPRNDTAGKHTFREFSPCVELHIAAWISVDFNLHGKYPAQALQNWRLKHLFSELWLYLSQPYALLAAASTACQCFGTLLHLYQRALYWSGPRQCLHTVGQIEHQHNTGEWRNTASYWEATLFQAFSCLWSVQKHGGSSSLRNLQSDLALLER